MGLYGSKEKGMVVVRGVYKTKNGWRVFYQNKRIKISKQFPTEQEAKEHRIYLENKYGEPIKKQNEPKEVADRIIGNWKIIGDTGKRTSQRGQIVLARHMETGMIKEMPLKSLETSGEKAGIYQTKNGGRQKFKKNFSKQYIAGTNINTLGRKTAKNKTGYIGVSFDKKRKLWVAQIRTNGKVTHLGRYINFEDAVLVRNRADNTFRKDLYKALDQEPEYLTKKEIEKNEYVMEKQIIIDKYRKKNPNE